MSTSGYWGLDDLDMLASDLDTNLSGLGGTTSAPFDMSEALSVLHILKSKSDEEERLENKTTDISTSLSKLDLPDGKESTIPIHKRSTKVVKKHCRKSLLESKCDRSDMSSNTSPEHNLEDGSLLRVASAPLLSQSLYKSSFQSGLVLKEDASDKTSFQYVLAAPTALGTKLGEETLTYLNQGQSYEIRLKKLNGLTEITGKLLKSMMRVGFQERRLQFREKDEIFAWQRQRPFDRILDIDLALSYGIFDVKSDGKDINCCEFSWDPSREASVFLRINCISTEFTSKRKGGEKGVAFRIVIETYSHWEDPPKKLHAAACLVKVFKAKGADRKHKTDREKLEKLPQSEQRDMQPSYQYTVFRQCSRDEEDNYNRDFLSSDNYYNSSYSSERCVKPDPSVSCVSETTNPGQPFYSQDHPVVLLKCKEEAAEESALVEQIGPETSSSHVCNWLVNNRFSKFLSHFSSFNGSDLLRLNREDLIEICGVADGIRFYNALHMRSIRPKLILYLSSGGQTFHAICLQDLTVKELKKQVCECCHLKEQNLKEIFVVGPSDILVYLTDILVKNMKNESVYIFEITKVEDDDKFCIIFQPYCSNQVTSPGGVCYLSTKDTDM